MKWLRIIPPIAVLAITFIVTKAIISNPIEPPKRPAPKSFLNVEGKTLSPEDYQVIITTQGNVEPHTETSIIPEVPGYITDVAPSFRDGGFFKRGDVLVEIDARDYELELINARANLAQAKAALETEKARGIQAKENWESLKLNEEPTALVLREPQLAEAEANVASAEARIEKANRDLERTKIKAPYDGRIRGKGADVGQYVSPGTVLARIFAVDYVEIRLPIPPKEASFIDLPEQLQNDTKIKGSKPKVIFSVDDAAKPQKWNGQIVRTEGVMDIRNRQVIAVAQIDNPYSPTSPDQSPLKIGQFVRAKISGETLKNHFVIPRSTVKEDAHVYLIDEANKLVKREVSIVWADAISDKVVVTGNFKKGDILCITPIPFAQSGMQVNPTIDGKAPAMPKRPAGQKKPGIKRDEKNREQAQKK